MPRVRFQIRTIMILIAVLAVLLGLLVDLLRWVAGPEIAPPRSLLYFALAMTLGPLFLSFIVFAVNRWRRRARRRQFSMSDNAPSEIANPTRSGEPERV